MSGARNLSAALLLGLVLGGAAGCGGAAKAPESPADAEYARLDESARAAFGRGQLEYARELYERVLVQARFRDDARRIGDAAFNLAACELALGGTDEARVLLDDAARELSRAGEPTAAVEVVRARLELGARSDARTTDAGATATDVAGPEAALAAAGRALDPAAGATERERVEALVLRGRAQLALGEVDAARASLRDAERAGGEGAPSCLELRARLALHEGRFADASHFWDEQAAALQAAGRFRAMSRALERAGEGWLVAGEPARAGDRWLRAARSRLAGVRAQGRPGRRAVADLHEAAALCARIAREGPLDADAGLAPRVERMAREIEAHRAELDASLSVMDVAEIPRD